MAQRVRISDIAAELGLSTATVSNVIHGKTGKVSDETVRRVQALLEERQYIPSMAGILLAQNASRIVGVFVNDHEKYEGHTLKDAVQASSLKYLLTEIEARGQFMMVKKARGAQEILQFAVHVEHGRCDRSRLLPAGLYVSALTYARAVCHV